MMRKVTRLYGAKRLQSLLNTYCQAVGIDDLSTASHQDWQHLYLHICDDFWSQRLTVSTFAGLSELLLLPSFEQKLGELEFVLCAAVDLAYYQQENDLSAFTSSITEVMKFYLKYRWPNTSPGHCDHAMTQTSPVGQATAAKSTPV